eukprot:jgi/Psemu1/328913/estExt_fgenesh1_pg.C_31120002
MTADTTTAAEEAAAENSTTDETTTTTTTTTTPPIVSVSNRLFLSHIDYTNHDGEENGKNKKNTNSNVNANSSCEEDLTTLELSPQTVKQRLEELFSKFGSVQEIYLSDKDKTKTKTKSKSVGENQEHDQKHDQEQERPPFAFIAMETAEEARAALNGLGLVTTGGGGQTQTQTQTQAASESARRLFRDLAPAKVHKSKKNKQNKSDRLRSERLQEYRQRLALVVVAAAAAAKDGSGTGTSTDTGKANATATAKPVANVVCQVHTSHLDRLRDFASEQEGVDLVGSYSAQKGTSFVMLRASDNDNHNHNDNHNDGDDVPERLSRKLWDTWYVAPNLNRVTVLDHYSDSTTSANNNNNNNNTGTSSTSTPVVVEGNLRNGVVPAIVKSLSQLGTGTRTRTGTTKDVVRLRLAVYPPKLQRTLLDALDNYTRTRTREAAKAKQDGNGNGNGKQHQHQHHPEIELSPGNPTHTISIIQLHPGVVVTPKSKGDNDKALNNNDNNDSPSPPPVVRHVVSTIQAALPSLVSDLAAATATAIETETATETPPTTSASATTTTTTATTTTKRVLDVWVSDMCVKDVRGQIDALLAARDACVVGPGTFFVLTLKCVVGYSAKAFEYQTNEQVARLSGISRDVQVVHLFSNRSSERTVIGYLI